MLYILLIIIAIGVLLLSEAGQTLVGIIIWLIIIGVILAIIGILIGVGIYYKDIYLEPLLIIVSVILLIAFFVVLGKDLLEKYKERKKEAP